MRYSAVCCALALLGWAGAGWSNDDAASAPFVFQEVSETTVNMRQLWDVAVDGADRVYVAGAAGVVILDARGREIRRIETPSTARAVAVDAKGERIYVAQRASVERYDGEGNRVT